MKVLLHAPDPSMKGGVATFCATITDYLKCDVDLFTFGPRSESYHRIFTPVRMLLDYARYLFIMVIKRHDVIQINPSFRIRSLIRDAVFALIAKCFQKKVIIFIHGWDFDFERRLRQKWLWLFQRAYFSADAFIVLATAFKARLVSMGYSGPIYLGSTALDRNLCEYLRANDPSPSCLAPFNILFLSRIEREKGIFEALKAYNLLKLGNLNVTITVAGDGGALEEAKQFVASQSIADVQFVGHVSGEDKVKVFQGAHCYLFPSYEEGMPISVLEAMAFGLPIVTRPVGALADFFSNGVMGFMTESKSPEIMSQLIKTLIADPASCSRMRKYNRNYALEHFTASRVASRLESIYRDVLGNSGKSK